MLITASTCVSWLADCHQVFLPIRRNICIFPGAALNQWKTWGPVIKSLADLTLMGWPQVLSSETLSSITPLLCLFPWLFPPSYSPTEFSIEYFLIISIHILISLSPSGKLNIDTVLENYKDWCICILGKENKNCKQIMNSKGIWERKRWNVFICFIYRPMEDHWEPRNESVYIW